MDWIQFLLLIICNIVLVLTIWCVNRFMNDSSGKKVILEILGGRQELLEIAKNIEKEVKDLHENLCPIERRHRK